MLPFAALLLPLLAPDPAPLSFWRLNDLARAPVLAVCFIEHTTLDESGTRAHAQARVLRSFPPSAVPPEREVALTTHRSGNARSC